MNKVQCHRVRFIGGPADGHVEKLPDNADDLPEEFIWFISENFFRLINGLDAGPQRPATSVALYEKAGPGLECRYEFLGSISPEYLSTHSPPRRARCAARPDSSSPRGYPAPPSEC